MSVVSSSNVRLDVIQLFWPGKLDGIPDCWHKDFIVMRDVMLGLGQYNGHSVFVDACRGKLNVVWAPCWWKHKHSRMLTTGWPIGNHTADRGEGVWPRFIHTQLGRVMQRTCSRSAERRAVCLKYNKRATCIITLSFRGKNVENKCGNMSAAVPPSSLCTDDNLDIATEM